MRSAFPEYPRSLSRSCLATVASGIAACLCLHGCAGREVACAQVSQQSQIGLAVRLVAEGDGKLRILLANRSSSTIFLHTGFEHVPTHSSATVLLPGMKLIIAGGEAVEFTSVRGRQPREFGNPPRVAAIGPGERLDFILTRPSYAIPCKAGGYAFRKFSYVGRLPKSRFHCTAQLEYCQEEDIKTPEGHIVWKGKILSNLVEYAASTGYPAE